MAKGNALLAASIALASLCLLLLAACATSAPSGKQDGFSAAPKDLAADSASAASDDSAADSASAASSSSPAPVLEKPNTEALLSLLDEETANKLIDQAKTDPDAAWIAAHPDAYEQYGPELQLKLVKLAADDPLAVPFVRGFPEKSPADDPNFKAPAMDTGSPSPDIPETGIPHFYQWDLRWGYTRYSEDGFGLAACGPTSMTMVYQGLTGKHDITPYDMGRLAEEQGYVVYGQGSTVGLFTELPWQLGLSCWEVPVDAASIAQTLSDGNPIIANVGAGYFTTVGHFFVLAGITEDGKVILNDPFSVERSSKLWDLDLIVSESKALFAYAAM